MSTPFCLTVGMDMALKKKKKKIFWALQRPKCWQKPLHRGWCHALLGGSSNPTQLGDPTLLFVFTPTNSILVIYGVWVPSYCHHNKHLHMCITAGYQNTHVQFVSTNILFTSAFEQIYSEKWRNLKACSMWPCFLISLSSLGKQASLLIFTPLFCKDIMLQVITKRLNTFYYRLHFAWTIAEMFNAQLH